MPEGFSVHVMTFCRCGWLMTDSPSGTYCENPNCLLKTRMFLIRALIEEIPVPQGAAA